MITGVHHILLAAPPGSEDALRAFYTDVLGLEEITKPPELARRGGAWFRTTDRHGHGNGHGIELHLGIEDTFRPARKAHPALLVHDLDALAARLRAAGHDITPDTLLPGHRRFYADDPVGNRLEFLEPARPSR
ncbi:putative enzyme related to lactoylglutathione lyase [Actinomadura pelletieri DSM 43383]|uniref:Putative enzyme related to lactoylglutathione lyase n=1 Tax=Actinomadura pelletieri DSM 43383 TaxID=1120940 RepID=A0A495QIZ3_9ACTN|nr:VOC family protein [Actinomadura pelletieri]RKS72089.1 putative enzyme related to lactoylglutathione lyase [Actinomadura pelletieri DSM 43383]